MDEEERLGGHNGEVATMATVMHAVFSVGQTAVPRPIVIRLGVLSTFASSTLKILD